MGVQTVTEPEVTTDPEPQQEPQTEEPTPTPEPEPAAAEPTEAAAVPPVTVEESKPEYMTVERWEQEKKAVADRAAADALEADRRRRQTENARRAKAEQEAREADQEAVDTMKAALGARGIYELPDDAAMAAINRMTQKKAQRLASQALDSLDSAVDYLTGKESELDPEAIPVAQRLGPRWQAFVDEITPQIEAKAREGYIAESELPKRVEAEIARRAAASRQGQENIPHVEGTPPSTVDRSLMAVAERIISGRADDEDRRIFRSSGYSLNNRR